MKTAEEWERHLQHSANFHLSEVSLLQNIKAIQLDAWKKGMQDAANLCKDPADYRIITSKAERTHSV